MATITVTTLNDNETSDGLVSLREAIKAANENVSVDGSAAGSGADIIVFDATLFPTGGTINLSSQLIPTGVLTIDGDVNGDNKADITVSGQDTTRHFYVLGADLTLLSLHLTDGGNVDDGGAILLIGSSLEMQDSRISSSSSNATLGTGGAISAGDSSMSLTNVLLDGNTSYQGGAINLQEGQLELVNVTVTGNSATNGSGVFVFGGPIPPSVEIVSSTFAANTGSASLQLFGPWSGSPINATIANSVFAGATGAVDVSGTGGATITATGNFLEAGSLGANNTNNGGDPGLGALAENGGTTRTMLPSTFSPLINAGSNASVPGTLTTAANGGARVQMSTVDIGAAETPFETPSLFVTTLNDVVDATDGLTSLREAIAYANSGDADGVNGAADTITFASDLRGVIRLGDTDGNKATAHDASLGTLTVTEALTIDGDGRITITGDRTGDDALQGPGSALTDVKASLDGYNATLVSYSGLGGLADNVRLFDTSADLTFDGMTLTGGAVSISDPAGGAARATGNVTVSLVDAIVSGNFAGGSGGGLDASAGTIEILRSVLSANVSLTAGGAIKAAKAVVVDSSINGNTASSGAGGLFATNITMDGSSVSGNSTRGSGGGIIAGTIDLDNSTVDGNTALLNNGGGLVVSGGGSISNATIAGNSANGYGGGISFVAGQVAALVIVNTTITGNATNAEGGGLYIRGAGPAGARVALSNSIVTGNIVTKNVAPVASDIEMGEGASLTKIGGNIVGANVYSFAGSLGGTTAGNVFAETVDIGGGVMAGVLADNGGRVKTVALKASATNPAIDASDSSAPATDARGVSRIDAPNIRNIHNGRADLGAYEAPLNKAPTITVQGTLDIAVGNAGSDNVTVLLGDGTGVFGALGDTGAGDFPTMLAAGDVDGDGDLDLFVANDFGSSVYYYKGDGFGGFTFAASFLPGGQAYSVGLGDLDGDGDLDLVAGAVTGPSGVGQIFLNDGLGGFVAGATIALRLDDFELGDVNGDGVLDLVAVNPNVDKVNVLLGNGAGGFSAPVSFDTGDGPFGMAIGDLDGDGNPDVVTANYWDDTVSVHLGNGLGGFGAPVALSAGLQTSEVQIADVNEDGHLDILATNEDGTASIILNDGTGGFLPRTQVAIGINAKSSRLADVSGDGHLDLISAGFNTDTVDVQLGDGSGGFAPLVAYQVGDRPLGLVLGDFDNTRVTDEDTAIVFDAAHGNAITLHDADSGGADETLTLTVANGTLTLATTAGLTSVTGDGTSSVTLVGSISELNAAIDGLIYQPDTDYSGGDKLTIALNDGGNTGVNGALTATTHVPLLVNAVNDAPAATITGATYSATEQTDLSLKGQLSVADVDAGAGAVTATLSVAYGILTIDAGGSGATVTNSGTGSVTITGTIAQINALLGSDATSTVVFNANTNAPPATTTLTLGINDGGNTGSGGALTASDTATITIAAVNDQPGAVGNILLPGVEDQPSSLAASSIYFVDPDGTDAVVTATVSVGGGMGTIAATTGSGVTVTNSGTAAITLRGTITDINALIAADKVIFTPTLNARGYARLDLSINDEGNTGSGGPLSYTTSPGYGINIQLGPVNDAPTAANNTVTSNEDVPYVFATADFGFADNEGTLKPGFPSLPDANALKAVIIETVPGSGTLKLNGVTLTAGASVAAALIAGGQLVYVPAANANGGNLGTFTFRVQDDGGTFNNGVDTSGIYTMRVDVTPVNDAPSLSGTQVLTSLIETADTTQPIKIADLTVTDIDQGSNVLSLSGADKDLFVFQGNSLYLKAGAAIDFETNPVLDVTVGVDDASVGTTPDATVAFVLNIIDGDDGLTILGNNRRNDLTGTGGGDWIEGRGGNDTINGGTGADTILGGRGADQMTGGAGPDLFLFRQGDIPGRFWLFDLWFGPHYRQDVITDFQPGIDTIDLSAMDANSRERGNQAFHFEGTSPLSKSRGELVYELRGSDAATAHTVIKGDTNGDGRSDFTILLTGHHQLTADDFVL